MVKQPYVCVSLWWLLLVSATMGTTPSQNSAGRLIEHWVGAFYKTCVPTRMVGGAYLFTGIIGARFGDGVTFVTRSNCTRRTLRRPVGGELIGSTCSVETGVVEDFAASEPRYALAKLLGVPEVRFPQYPFACAFDKQLTAAIDADWHGRRLLQHPPRLDAGAPRRRRGLHQDGHKCESRQLT